MERQETQQETEATAADLTSYQAEGRQEAEAEAAIRVRKLLPLV
jgi:hypothetical protein